jgi:hypothetical protein
VSRAHIEEHAGPDSRQLVARFSARRNTIVRTGAELLVAVTIGLIVYSGVRLFDSREAAFLGGSMAALTIAISVEVIASRR